MVSSSLEKGDCMRNRFLKPKVRSVEETSYGKLLLCDPRARKVHENIVSELREAARSEIAALISSERRTWDDLHIPTLH